MGHVCLLSIQRQSSVPLLDKYPYPSPSSCLLSLPLIPCPLSLWGKEVFFVLRTCSGPRQAFHCSCAEHPARGGESSSRSGTVTGQCLQLSIIRLVLRLPDRSGVSSPQLHQAFFFLAVPCWLVVLAWQCLNSITATKM